ncbi:MAG TPA: hypothetical protein PLE39_04265 [Anaerolineales bacterium]|nr:hypothetical protein [Anaerolineales bacterium]
MNTLKLNRRPLILPLWSGLIGILPLTFLFDPPRASLKSLLELSFVNLFTVGVLVFFIWFYFVRIKKELKYRIVFTSEAIEENQNKGFYSSRPRRILYSDVLSVQYLFPGVIVVRSKNEEDFKFVLADIEGGADRVMELLKTHLPGTVIDEKLPEKMEKNSILVKINDAGMVLFLPLITIPVLGVYGFFQGGWNVHRLPWNEFLLDFSITSKNSPWIASTDFNGDNLIVHFDDQEQRWPLPLQNPRGTIILSDSNGQPTLITGEINYTWQDGKWLQWKYFGVYKAAIYRKRFVSTTEQAWLVLYGDNKPNVLVGAIAGRPGVDVIQLPESAVQKGYEPYSLSILADETVLVHAGNENEARIFLLKDGQWLEKSYDVPFDFLQVKDFIVDDVGRLFIFYTTQTEEVESYFVQIQDDEKALITEIPLLGEFSDYDSLLVDSHDRLWILDDSYGGGVTVLRPVWSGVAELVVQYNKENSNYPRSGRSSFVLDADGKVWVSSEDLYWIDSTASELPRPMPDWLMDIGYSDTGYLKYIAILAGVFLGGYGILYLLSTKELKK